jgi:hypothetical protein
MSAVGGGPDIVKAHQIDASDPKLTMGSASAEDSTWEWVWHSDGLETGPLQAHIDRARRGANPMAFIRGVLGAALVGITFGGYPAKWWSAAIAVALCVAAAFALHFVAP